MSVHKDTIIRSLFVGLLLAHPLIQLLGWFLPPYPIVLGILRIDQWVTQAIVNHFSQIIVALFSLLVIIFCSNKVYKVQEHLRFLHFRKVMKQFRNSSTAPPLLLYYLLFPPRSLSGEVRSNINDPLYPEVVRRLRMWCYKGEQEKSRQESSATGFHPAIWLLIFSFILILYSYWVAYDGFSLLSVWLAPIACGLSARVYTIAKAVALHYRYLYTLNQTMLHFFGTEHPLVKRDDLLKHGAWGEQILRSWKKDCTYRQLRYHEMLGKPPGEVLFYTVQTLAQRPYDACDENPQNEERVDILMENPAENVIVFPKLKHISIPEGSSYHE